MRDREKEDPFAIEGPGIKKRLHPDKDLVLDYRDPDTLRPFITDAGKIIPRRVSRLSAKQQRNLTTQVKRARQLALLPYVSQHTFGAHRS